MFECLILGDQIAQGMADNSKGCVSIVRPELDAIDFFAVNYKSAIIQNTRWDLVIISVNLNNVDKDAKYIERGMRLLRSTISADIVYWLVSTNADSDARNAIVNAAMGRGDGVIEYPELIKSKDLSAGTYKSMWEKIDTNVDRRR